MKHLVHYFACAMTLTSYAALTAPEPKQLFSLTIASPKEPIKAGTELRLLVTVTNTSDRTINFITSPGSIPEDGARYEIDVRDAQGSPASPSANLRTKDNRVSTDYGSRVSRTLRASESFVDKVTVTRFYDLSQPGNYTIWVALPIPPRQNLGEGKIKSNSITVTVVP
jgi:hypothetical protein